MAIFNRNACKMYSQSLLYMQREEEQYRGGLLYRQYIQWHLWVRRRGCIGSWWGNRREVDHWRDLGVDGGIILERISRRWDVGIWTGLGWLRIETGGVRL